MGGGGGGGTCDYPPHVVVGFLKVICKVLYSGLAY